MSVFFAGYAEWHSYGFLIWSGCRLGWFASDSGGLDSDLLYNAVCSYENFEFVWSNEGLVEVIS
jgi:hypothetical protein